MERLLSVENLVIEIAGDAGSTCVLDRVGFDVRVGEILGVVGESGCGKSIMGLSLLGLLPRGGRVVQGSAVYAGDDLYAMDEERLDEVRGREIGMVFQDAPAGLDPVYTVGDQLLESILAHEKIGRAQAKARAKELLATVGLPDATIMKKYPHTLSGGQRQRVMIAMALSCRPRLLIADEPTTALDVTIQAQIMELLRKLQREQGMSILLITHDIGLVAQMTNRVMVMYAGQVVECAPTAELFAHPAHPYTRALLRAVPHADGENEQLHGIPGSVPERYGEMVGCRFASRCPYATDLCKQPQHMQNVDAHATHTARCCRWNEGRETRA